MSNHMFSIVIPLLQITATGIDRSILDWGIFLMVVAVFVVIQTLLIYTAVRFRQHPVVSAATVGQQHHSRWRELVWTLLPAIGTTVILCLTLQTLLTA